MLPGVGHVEHDDRQLVVHAERDRGRVHHLQAPVEHLEVADLGELHRGRVEARDRRCRRRRRRSACPSGSPRRRSRRPRSAAVVSVVKYGLPVPAANTTTRPFSRWRIARSGMYGSATWAIVIAVCTRVGWPTALERVLQRERVDHGGEHAHVVGAGAVHAPRRADHARGRCCRRRRRPRSRRRARRRASATSSAMRCTTAASMPKCDGRVGERLARELQHHPAEPALGHRALLRSASSGGR